MISFGAVSVSFIPVLALLLALILLDSYKLIGLRAVLLTMVAGGIAALVSFGIARLALHVAFINPVILSRYIAPVVEETLKAACVVYLFRAHRVGFMVDAAIYGFAVGTGFALVENLYYLHQMTGATFIVWIIRGFGTAAIHGATMAMFAVISKTVADRRNSLSPGVFVPGLIMAIVTHSLYNHFILSPILSTVVILIVLPLLVVAVFERSERATRRWLGVGFDADQEILRLLSAGEISESPIGRYLESLRTHFPGTVVADMFCYLTLHTELALRAKGIMMMREAGIKPPPDPEIAAKLNEMQFLERSIGKTGRLAIQPFLHTSARDIWQLKTIQ